MISFAPNFVPAASLVLMHFQPHSLTIIIIIIVIIIIITNFVSAAS